MLDKDLRPSSNLDEELSIRATHAEFFQIIPTCTILSNQYELAMKSRTILPLMVQLVSTIAAPNDTSLSHLPTMDQAVLAAL